MSYDSNGLPSRVEQIANEYVDWDCRVSYPIRVWQIVQDSSREHLVLVLMDKRENSCQAVEPCNMRKAELSPTYIKVQ